VLRCSSAECSRLKVSVVGSALAAPSCATLLARSVVRSAPPSAPRSAASTPSPNGFVASPTTES
jgi:hypothetical protein